MKIKKSKIIAPCSLPATSMFNRSILIFKKIGQSSSQALFRTVKQLLTDREFRGIIEGESVPPHIQPGGQSWNFRQTKYKLC